MKPLKFFFLLLIFFACNKSLEEIPEPPIEPPATPQTSISMDINGIARDDLTGKGSFNDHCLSIRFSQAGVSMNFTLEKLEEKTYHFGKGNYNQFLIHFGPTRISSIDLTPENAGFLTITEIDHEQQLIHGNFEVFFGDISNGKFENIEISEGAVCFRNEYTEEGVRQFEGGELFSFSQNDTIISLFTDRLGLSLDKREIQQKTNVEDLINSLIIGFLQIRDSSISLTDVDVFGTIETLELNEKNFFLNYDFLFKHQSDSLALEDGHLEVYF